MRQKDSQSTNLDLGQNFTKGPAVGQRKRGQRVTAGRKPVPTAAALYPRENHLPKRRVLSNERRSATER